MRVEGLATYPSEGWMRRNMGPLLIVAPSSHVEQGLAVAQSRPRGRIGGGGGLGAPEPMASLGTSGLSGSAG